MPLGDVLLGLTVSLLWGFNFVVMKVGVGELPPFLLAGLRFALSVVPLILLVPRPAVSWRLLAAFALSFGVVKFSLLFFGLGLGMPAGLTSIVLQLQAPFTVLLATLVLGERVDGVQMAGLAVALAGLAVLAAERIATSPLLPFLLVLAAAVAWAVANLVVKQATDADPLGFALWASLLAAGPFLALSLAIEGPHAIASALAAASWKGLGALLYLAYPVNLIGLAIWSRLLRRHSAAAVAPFALLVPVVGTLSGHLVLGETLTPWLAIGGSTIIVGLATIVLGPRLFARPAVSPR